MKRNHGIAATLLATVIVSVLPAEATIGRDGADHHIAYVGAHSYYEAHVNLAEPERERIRKHLALVEDDMRRNIPAGLSEAQVAKRLALLDTLRAYRERGEFPRNLDFPDRLIPYFIDAAGVPCAMGKLIIASGHGALAEDVRARMNNAYIAEIAAADARLAAWGEEHGITLEEAARVQPGYGPPNMTMVWRIDLDGAERPWVMGPDDNSMGAGVLGYRDSTGWKYAGSAYPYIGDFCATRDGRVLVVSGQGGVQWPFAAISPPANPGQPGRLDHLKLQSCAWQAGDTVAWAGGDVGLVRLRPTVADTLAPQMLATPAGTSDTILSLAVSANRVWAGTRNGLYARLVAQSDSVRLWDSAALGGRRMTGLKASETVLWVGVEGAEFGGEMARFSSRGLRRIRGDSVRTYRATMSSVKVPGDTIHALAVRDSGSVWLATSTGFYLFSGTASTPKVADLPAPGLIVNDMAGDADGFYAATNQGVYQYRNDALVFIGSPGVSLRPGPVTRRPPAEPRLTGRLQRTRAGDATAVTVLGRQAGPVQAAGVYVSPPQREVTAD